jgi:DNA invertase Pin-like site-specific DNA recombinase
LRTDPPGTQRPAAGVGGDRRELTTRAPVATAFIKAGDYEHRQSSHLRPVSTHEQTPRTQLRELKIYAQRRRFRVAHTLVEKESGAKPDRPKLQELMELARKRKVDVVLVWKFDRFARSTQQLLSALEEFRELGVNFISYTENIDTSTPIGKALFTIVSAIAEFERDLIKERVRAGIARARAEGVALGRPALAKETIREMRALRRQGESIRWIADELGCSVGVVTKYTRRQSRRR